MSYRFLGCLAALSLASCSGSREPSSDSPIVALHSPSATSTPPAIPASSAMSTIPSSAAPADSVVVEMPAPSASAAAGPPPAYPDGWIQRARSDNSSLSCMELVYKNGCSQTRTGVVTFRVTIDDNGTVVQFSEMDNQIHHDKAVVSRCLKKTMPRWKFHPPEGHEKTFQVRVALSDKC